LVFAVTYSTEIEATFANLESSELKFGRERNQQITEELNNETNPILFPGRLGSLCHGHGRRGCRYAKAACERSLLRKDMEEWGT
jgi:hypothetical protein